MSANIEANLPGPGLLHLELEQRTTILCSAGDEAGVATIVRSQTGLVASFDSAVVSLVSSGPREFAIEFTSSKGRDLKVQLVLGTDCVYGGGNSNAEYWPTDRGHRELRAETAYDNGPRGQGTLSEPAFVLSSGAYFMCEADSPYLFVGLNQLPELPRRKWAIGLEAVGNSPLPQPASDRVNGGGDRLLTLQVRESYFDSACDHPLTDFVCGGAGESRVLRATWGLASDVRCAATIVRQRLKASGTGPSACQERACPPIATILRPIWTSWARYHDAVTQLDVLSYAEEIASRGLPRSVFEIDDRWSTAYGDFVFDPIKFPDPAAMVDSLHSMGFQVTVWIIPFLSERSMAFTEAKERGFLVRTGKDVAGADEADQVLFPFWQPGDRVAALDVSNPEATLWFVQRLERLRADIGLDGFKFDAGEPCWLPTKGHVRTHTVLAHPNEYTRYWITRVASSFALSEVRAGVRGCQGVASRHVWTRMFDKASTWDEGGGLRSLIPTLLQCFVCGYDWSLPDMVGGNSYKGRPEAELLVRWAQATALMPCMQLSLVPWDAAYDSETEALVIDAIHLREREGKRLERAAMAAAKDDGTPFITPVWWLEPTDPRAFEADQEFLVGADLLVAPVVHRGSRSRDVFFPSGKWRQQGTNESDVLEGPALLYDVPAPLNVLLRYERVDDVGGISGS